MIKYTIIISVLSGCKPQAENSNVKPWFDIKSPKETAAVLCEQLSLLTKIETTENQYSEAQAKVELIYKIIHFSIRSGFYTKTEIVQEAEQLSCVI